MVCPRRLGGSAKELGYFYTQELLKTKAFGGIFNGEEFWEQSQFVSGKAGGRSLRCGISGRACSSSISR
jgi:hypothetical protein